MPDDRQIADAYTLAKRAEWAGDVEFFRARMAELRELTRGEEKGNDWAPAALLRRAGESMAEHMEGREAPPRGLVLATGHLRGVVWQTGPREFEMSAYLSDPSWEESLFKHAALAADAPGATPPAEERDDGDGQSDRETERARARQVAPFPDAERASAVDSGPGMSWDEEVDGLFCSTTVSDLGLIKIRGLWAGREAPEAAREIVSRFRGILARIDPAEVLVPEESV